MSTGFLVCFLVNYMKFRSTVQAPRPRDNYDQLGFYRQEEVRTLPFKNTSSLEDIHFVIDHMRFVNLIYREHAPGNHFVKYNFHLLAENLNKKSPEEAIARHVEFYYTAPLLSRSIFSRTASYLKGRQEPDLANKIINKTRQLIKQNGLNSLS